MRSNGEWNNHINRWGLFPFWGLIFCLWCPSIRICRIIVAVMNQVLALCCVFMWEVIERGNNSRHNFPFCLLRTCFQVNFGATFNQQTKPNLHLVFLVFSYTDKQTAQFHTVGVGQCLLNCVIEIKLLIKCDVYKNDSERAAMNLL